MCLLPPATSIYWNVSATATLVYFYSPSAKFLSEDINIAAAAFISHLFT